MQAGCFQFLLPVKGSSGEFCSFNDPSTCSPSNFANNSAPTASPSISKELVAVNELLLISIDPRSASPISEWITAVCPEPARSTVNVAGILCPSGVSTSIDHAPTGSVGSGASVDFRLPAVL